MLPLQAVGRGRGGARLLDDDRNGPHAGSLRDLQDVWERLRETAISLGDQRIYASHKSVMFSRKSCYFFVRPKRNFLEVCVFLWAHAEGSSGATRRSRIEVQDLCWTMSISTRESSASLRTAWPG